VTPRLEPISSLGSVRDEWSRLAERSGNVFAAWEWHDLWWRHFGRARALRAVACRDGAGKLFAILPLYLWRRFPLRVARFLGHGPGDVLGPICAPEDADAASAALRDALAASTWDVFVGEHLPGDIDWTRLLGGRALSRAGNPVLRADGDWDDYLATRSRNLRGQVRARERRLAREYELTYRLAAEPKRLSADLDLLFSLHRARWGTKSSFAGAAEQFHREFAVAAFERGWLRLWFLELDRRPVAAWYGLRFAGVESYYQAGRSPAAEGLSVGFVLLAHTIRAALDDGIREYRFLLGGEDFKHRFATGDAGLVTIGDARGIVGRRALSLAEGLRELSRSRTRALRGERGQDEPHVRL